MAEFTNDEPSLIHNLGVQEKKSKKNYENAFK